MCVPANRAGQDQLAPGVQLLGLPVSPDKPRVVPISAMASPSIKIAPSAMTSLRLPSVKMLPWVMRSWPVMKRILLARLRLDFCSNGGSAM